MIAADANIWLYRLIESDKTALAKRVWEIDKTYKPPDYACMK